MTYWLLATACSPEQTFHPKDDEFPPADPPGIDEDLWGSPPDWNDCFEGVRGMYYNLDATNPAVVQDPALLAPLAGSPLDLMTPTELVADEFDASIDFGQNWWPVDEGIADDPQYFAVRWVAWMRAFSDTSAELSLGASTDAWVILEDDPLVSIEASPVYAPASTTQGVDAGQWRLDIRYVHRQGDTDGFRFRVLQGDVKICYPDY